MASSPMRMAGRVVVVGMGVGVLTVPREPAPAIGPTAEYGKYVARVGSCLGCRGLTESRK